MDENHTNRNRIAALVVAAVVSAATLVGGGIALAGASDTGPDNTPEPVVDMRDAALDQIETAPVQATARIEATAPIEPVALVKQDAADDCDAFFAELDAEHNANSERFAKVLAMFGINHELVVDGDYTYVDVDYEDPIVESISNSFWIQVADNEDADLYDHPCFQDGPFEGCEEFAEGDYEEFEEEMDDVDDHEHGDDAELDDYGELDAQWEAEWKQMLAERNASLEALAAALGDAGVEHELTTDYDWVSVTFDLDDERAIPVIEALLVS